MQRPADPQAERGAVARGRREAPATRRRLGRPAGRRTAPTVRRSRRGSVVASRTRQRGATSASVGDRRTELPASARDAPSRATSRTASRSPGSAIRLHAARAVRSSSGTNHADRPPRPPEASSPSAPPVMPRPAPGDAAGAPGRRRPGPGLPAPVEIGDRPGEPQNPVVAADGQPAAVERAIQVRASLPGCSRSASRSHDPGTSPLRPTTPAASRSRCADRACQHPGGDDRTRLRRDVEGHLGAGHRAHLHLEVDPVEQRAGQPAEVAPPGQRGAGAVLALARRPPARARVRGQHELEPRGEPGRTHGPGGSRARRAPAAAAAPPAPRTRTRPPRRGTARRGGPGTPPRAAASPLPPPTRAGTVAVWCGSSNGGRRSRPAASGRGCRRPSGPPSPRAPARRSRSGSSPGSRAASIVLPAPGRPEQEQVVPAGGGDLEGLAGRRPARRRRRGRAGVRRARGLPGRTRGCRTRLDVAVRRARAGFRAVARVVARVVVGCPAAARPGAARPRPRRRPDGDDLGARHEPGLGRRSPSGRRAGAGRRGPRRAPPAAPPGPAAPGRRARARPGARARPRRPRRPARSRRAARRRPPGRTPVPAFGSAAGDRFTVIRRGGSGQPEFAVAARTRSRASVSAVSGQPDQGERRQARATSASTCDQVPLQARPARPPAPVRAPSRHPAQVLDLGPAPRRGTTHRDDVDPDVGLALRPAQRARPPRAAATAAACAGVTASTGTPATDDCAAS